MNFNKAMYKSLLLNEIRTMGEAVVKSWQEREAAKELVREGKAKLEWGFTDEGFSKNYTIVIKDVS